jgi:hypothetical protein
MRWGRMGKPSIVAGQGGSFAWHPMGQSCKDYVNIENMHRKYDVNINQAGFYEI